jgi:hypothetical protein
VVTAATTLRSLILGSVLGALVVIGIGAEATVLEQIEPAAFPSPNVSLTRVEEGYLFCFVHEDWADQCYLMDPGEYTPCTKIEGGFFCPNLIPEAKSFADKL